MADDTQQQDRTEQPTPKRREDARKKGNVPRSRELTMTCVMLAGASGLLILANPIGSKILRAISDSLSIGRQQIFDTSHMPDALGNMISYVLLGLAPFGLVVVMAAFAGTVLIGGWSFSVDALAFKSERLSPLKGIKRIFSANGLNELVKAFAKFALVATAAVVWLWYCSDDLLSLGRQPIRPAITGALYTCGISFLIVSTTLIFIALVDVPFQLWNYKKKLKMTRQEVRDEFKDTEGRPEVKSRIRTLQQQIANRRMMEKVQSADVVVTNPTHYAIALKYDDLAMRAPKVIAKGKDLLATRIRERAEEHDVPLFSAPPLARALYRSTKLDHEIPAGLYTAVAQVLAYIYQLKNVVRGAFPISRPILPDIDEGEY